MHRKDEESTVTEDDINEVKSDISAMRYEMLEIFERNGMDISTADKKEKGKIHYTTVLSANLEKSNFFSQLIWQRK